ncbi:spermidine/putrescine ABC transporter substrate-binding protein [Cohnella pontilimi]|uniref:Spermidine/putrescine ABC transporter substrate-binding protein n=1 Tax=Cohnella pontilimi TaxID=2564100 RepID=A0A4V5LSI7_9BACL|nr:spermidine/putrescine ABC transporter substrate-binding protein [Cohnella pontilimi]TJY42349.1 spermidine/putrescine ABC transporter substrate-binding protein [Cohnella pontilimi]
MRMTWLKPLTILTIFALAAASVLAGCGSKSGSDGEKQDKVLNVFNWSEYLPESVVEKFENQYGVKVNYNTYSSNEEMLAKLSVGSSGYDIAVASEFMVEIMIHQGLLQEIGLNHIPNFKNIGGEFKNLAFDPGNKFSVPYMWGDAMIAVDRDKVKEPITGYKDLWNPKFKNSLVILDDQRAVMGMALKKLGYSINEKDETRLQEAKQELKKLLPNIKAYDSDSPKTMLINGEASIGYVWGAEAALAHREKPSIQYVLPEEGLYIWQDNFVIPKNAPHKKMAETFINFILDPNISAEISDAFPYANPNTEALKLIDKSIIEDIAVYLPNDILAKGEHLAYIGEAAQLYDRIWSEIKQ